MTRAVAIIRAVRVIGRRPPDGREPTCQRARHAAADMLRSLRAGRYLADSIAMPHGDHHYGRSACQLAGMYVRVLATGVPS